jgi:Uma2 family endonuclease
MTAEEFTAMEDDGNRYELVRGELIEMSRPSGEHGQIQFQIAWLLKNLVTPNKLGWVGGESGIVTERDPDTVRGPDVYFYSIARLAKPPKGFIELPPDLVVEVISPSDTRPAMRKKVREYIAGGVRLVWVVDPETRTVSAYAGSMRGTEYDEADTLDGGDVLPEFHCKVADFFE